MPAGRRKWEPGEREELVERAKVMRRQGRDKDEIAEALGIGSATATRWTKNIIVPGKSTAATKAMTASKKAEIRADRDRNRIDTSIADTSGERRRVLVMPRDLEGYMPTTDDDGIAQVNPRLTSHAKAMLTTWRDDKAEGNLYTVTDLERAKATIVLASSFGIHDNRTFLSQRKQWGAIRELAGVSMEDFAKPLDIAYVSISRYEGAKRNPDAAILGKLHLAYTALQDQAIERAEWLAAIASYWDVHGLDPDTEVDGDLILRWIAREDSDRPELEDYDIDHIAGLAHVRGMLPYPTWREPTPGNLWLKGYAETPVKV